jgi:hypothetical protein
MQDWRTRGDAGSNTGPVSIAPVLNVPSNSSNPAAVRSRKQIHAPVVLRADADETFHDLSMRCDMRILCPVAPRMRQTRSAFKVDFSGISLIEPIGNLARYTAPEFQYCKQKNGNALMELPPHKKAGGSLG